jgi:cysteine desulfurase
VIQDIERISEIARSHNVLFHVDAAQSLGKIPINVKESKIDLISLCAHKIYGPKGIGALFVKSNPAILLETEMHGGGQENGLRSGTLATHQIVGMGRAFKLAKEQLDYDRQHAVCIKKTILNELSKIEGLSINTPQLNSIPNILNLSIDSIKNIILLSRLKNVAISSGSACSSSSIQSGSHVLKAMGLSDERINNSIRISWGRFTTIDDIKLGCDALKVAIKSIRN